MKRFIVKALAALMLAMPFAVPTGTAQAGTTAGHGRVYYVYGRSCAHQPWFFYYSTTNYNSAVSAANALRHYGYESFIR